MRFRFFRLTLGIALNLVLVPAFHPALGGTSGTTVVYDNFGPGDTYANFGVWYGTHPGLHNAWEIVATSVVLSQGGALTDITLGMRTSGDPNAGNRNEFVLSVCLDNNSKPGTIIWQQNFVNELALGPLHGGITTLENVQGPLLSPGQRYWFVADTPADDTNTYHIWDSGLTGSTLVAHMNGVLFGWEVSGQTGRAMRLAVIVPEPACAAAVLGLPLVLCPRRRRQSVTRRGAGS